eukprot:6182921-Pleurochrysis_carterae.AAC.1
MSAMRALGQGSHRAGVLALRLRRSHDRWYTPSEAVRSLDRAALIARSDDAVRNWRYRLISHVRLAQGVIRKLSTSESASYSLRIARTVRVSDTKLRQATSARDIQGRHRMLINLNGGRLIRQDMS